MLSSFHHFANTGLEIILVSTLATISTQLFKVIWFLGCQGKMNFRIFFHTGGMPSSHSACMASLATSVGLVEGFHSTDFAIALGLALVVMYDAAGVRRAAGKMAGILNQITEEFYQHQPEHLPERLRELLGHTPTEVLVGCLWGLVIAYSIHYNL